MCPLRQRKEPGSKLLVANKRRRKEWSKKKNQSYKTHQKKFKYDRFLRLQNNIILLFLNSPLIRWKSKIHKFYHLSKTSTLYSSSLLLITTGSQRKNAHKKSTTHVFCLEIHSLKMNCSLIRRGSMKSPFKLIKFTSPSPQI